LRIRVIAGFIYKELKTFLNDKVAMFWMIAWPLIWVFLPAYVFIPSSSIKPLELDVGVVNHDMVFNNSVAGFTSIDFINMLNNTTYEGYRLFNVKNYSSVEELKNDLRKGRIDLGIIIPEGFSENITRGVARIHVLIGARDLYSSSLNYVSINTFIDQLNKYVGLVKAEIMYNTTLRYMNSSSINQTIDPEVYRYIHEYYVGIAMSINATYENVKPEAFTDRPSILGWMVFGSVGMMFLYSGLAIGSVAMINEKENGSLKRILASPITTWELLVSIILSGITVMSISASISILAGAYIVGAKIIFNPSNPLHWIALILLVDGAFMSIGLGIMLSLLAKSTRSASSLGTVLGLMLTFTTGIWYPRTMLPQWMSVLADVFPVTWVLDSIRNILVYEMGWDMVWRDFVRIGLATIAILLIDLIMYRYGLKKYSEEA